ncbi:MAG TPA: FAD-binding protein [Gammaproteobacteria bacterium]|nr:FAD-binding protein [Gammaproteobacteria bacterium]
MKILVIAEVQNQTLMPATGNALGAGIQLGGMLDVLIVGSNSKACALEVAKVQGVNKVLLASDPLYEHPIAENLDSMIVALSEGYSHIIAAATTFGKNLMPRVAAKLDVAQISDVTKIVSENTFRRPIYAGNAFETVQVKDAKKIITIRPTAFEAPLLSSETAAIEPLTLSFKSDRVTFVSHVVPESTRPELTTARIVLSGGRGLGSAENFKILEEIADKLHAAIGATRAAVDAGFISNDCQIGQTGKIVAPDLYIAVGISGAIQHIAGIKDSKIIVAINKDPDAPIFQIADYGLVGDLFTLLPELNAAL